MKHLNLKISIICISLLTFISSYESLQIIKNPSEDSTPQNLFEPTDPYLVSSPSTLLSDKQWSDILNKIKINFTSF